ncbi:MAG TPA: BON domain-containing protein, partial [Leucothrix sp.]|nr:BON domain-containing protein [Leucothrix sp.]
MVDKRRCSGLSKGWWWFLALIGLAFLYFLMLSAKWNSIEKDIQTRTSEKISSSGADRVTVEIKKRGRDVLLNGIASTETEREQVIKIAKAVTGVRIVEDNIKVVALSSPDFSLTSNADHKVTLSGTMPSQDNIDKLLNATVSAFGTDNVENKLSIGKHIASPSWLSDINPLISDLKGVKNAGLELSADIQKISGVVRTEDKKTTVLSKFTSLFGDKVTDQLTVQPLKKPSLQVSFKDGKVKVEGVLGSQKKIDEVINKVADKVGKDNVINKLTLDDDYSSTDGTINLIGEATSKDSYNLVISAVQQGGEVLGLNFDNKLTLNDLEAIAAEKAEAERIAQEKAAAEKAE